ncbi:MAG: CTP synthetase [Rhodobacterales bacterium]|nr:MAG: CTP synthetase [Rhodobacterales bacterium]
MLRVAMLLYSILGASLAGTFMIVALVIGQDTARPIIISAVLGFVAAIPLALVVAKKLTA